MKNSYYYRTAIGLIGISENETGITDVFFMNQPDPLLLQKESPLIKRTISQLREYLNGTRQVFDLPLAPQGTPFQQSVWKELLKIPYGSTRSYQDVAKAIGKPQACRAVGMANNRNPLVIIIPCHRVIGAGGKLVGYGGGLAIKAKLLELEKTKQALHSES
ncbi:Methylated-DNA--protein-cysteine methyltransferase, constitutive [bioreactor metagenome]|uniref:methylated-DNA--[protein]-cysteine S-methyltransferase n=1 Tax=bioreactor metagenome TaxID=1076179 RepID=A0A645DIT5_9ZZZZ